MLGFRDFGITTDSNLSQTKVEAMFDIGQARPFDVEYWATKRPDLSKIQVPAFVIASWSDRGLYTCGDLDAFEKIASKHKYLQVHGQNKLEYFHRPSTFEHRKAFFDQYLKGQDDTIKAWPVSATSCGRETTK